MDIRMQAKDAREDCAFCRKIKNLAKIYTFIFARPSMQLFNDVIFQLALRGKGYENCCNIKATGEEKLIRIISNLNPKLCIDVGANTGHYSEALLRLTTANVIAFEPLPKAFDKLIKIKSVYPNRLIAVNEGVGAKSEQLDLHFGGEESELASFSGETMNVDYVMAQNKNTIKVQVNSLDNYFKTNSCDFSEIDLLKIDVEGFEYEVLTGAENTINKMRPKFIQIEYNWHQLFTGHSLFNISKLLPEYILYQLLPHGKGLCRRDSRKPETNIYHYSNFVFIRSDISI